MELGFFCALLMLVVALKLPRRALRFALLVSRQRRQWRTVPLPQRNTTRATFGGFVVAFGVGFAATGIPFQNPVAAWALAGSGTLGLVYLIAGGVGSQGARFDVISVFWWGIGALSLAAALLHFKGMI